MSSVWCQVVKPDGSYIDHPVLIEPIPKNINDLCKAVKTEMTNALKYCDASQLTVFPAGTTNFDDTSKAYKPWLGCPGAEGENPLIVVAPQKESGTSCAVVLS